MSREVRLKIGSQEITVRSDEDNEYLDSLAAFVAQRMSKVGRGQDGSTTLSLALAAALSIADDLHRLQQATEGLDSELDGASEAIESLLSIDQS